MNKNSLFKAIAAVSAPFVIAGVLTLFLALLPVFWAKVLVIVVISLVILIMFAFLVSLEYESNEMKRKRQEGNYD